MFAINLNKESAAVLLRCLGYGQIATSQEEAENGIGKLIEDNCGLLRAQICTGLSREILADALQKERLSCITKGANDGSDLPEVR